MVAGNMRWSPRSMVRYPVLGSLIVLAAVLSFYYFVSSGGTYDPAGGIGSHGTGVHQKISARSSERDDLDSETDTAHHLRQQSKTRKVGLNDDNNDSEERESARYQDEEETLDDIEKAKARIRKHCNPPDKKITGAEGKVPAGYKLEMVQILVRHGDRSPMTSIPGYPMAKINCKLDRPELQHPRIKEFIHKMSHGTSPGRFSAARKLGLYPNHRYCEGAQLTGIGTVQHILNGEFLHKVYTDKWDLIGEKGREVEVKTSDYSRTYQSAVALLFGLLPKLDISKMRINIIQNTQLCSNQYIEGHNCKCPAVKEYQKTVKSEYTKRSQNNQLHAHIRKEMADLLAVRSSRLPWIAAIIDVVLGHVCHSDKLPCFSQSGKCLTWQLIGQMWEFLDFNGREQNQKSEANEKLQRLTMHPLLVEISRRLQNFTHGKVAKKFVLYSGHDTTVMPLAVALGIHDGLWPPYATRLVIELYSKATANDNLKYYIRVLFNGQDRTKLLHFCYNYVNRDNLCPLQRFIDFVNIENMNFFNAQNYADACSR